MHGHMVLRSNYSTQGLSFGEFAILPWSAEDGALHEAAKAFATSFGREFMFASWQTPVVDMCHRPAGVPVPRSRRHSRPRRQGYGGRVRPRLQPVRAGSAWGVRRPGKRRVRGRYVHSNYRKVTDVPITSEQEELLRMMSAFTDHPQAKLLADLFSEACRDTNPSAASLVCGDSRITRGALSRAKHEKVRRACPTLESPIPRSRVAR